MNHRSIFHDTCEIKKITNLSIPPRFFSNHIIRKFRWWQGAGLFALIGLAIALLLYVYKNFLFTEDTRKHRLQSLLDDFTVY